MKLLKMLSVEQWAAFFAIMAAFWGTVSGLSHWVENVNAYDGRITKVELGTKENAAAIDKSNKLLFRMDFNIQMIGRKIGVTPLEPPKQ